MLINYHIKEAFLHKDHLLAVFFDITKAFDTIWKYKILKTLHHLHIRGNILHFIQNFLNNRNFMVRIENTLSSSYPLDNGVPQNTVLSPTLFNIATNDLPQTIPPLVSKSLFADDICIFVRCRDSTVGEKLLQQTTNQIHLWSLNNGLNFSHAKSTAVHFCRHYSCP